VAGAQRLRQPDPFALGLRRPFALSLRRPFALGLRRPFALSLSKGFVKLSPKGLHSGSNGPRSVQRATASCPSTTRWYGNSELMPPVCRNSTRSPGLKTPSRARPMSPAITLPV